MNTWTWTLGSVVVVSLVSFVGLLFMSRGRARLDSLLMYLVSLAAGVLLGSAFFHLLPEAWETFGNGRTVPLLFLTGFLGFFFLERFLWAHHHGHGDEPVTGRPVGEVEERKVKPVVVMSLVGDGLHNFIDGMIIAAAYVGGVGLGLVTTGAVLLHEVPQEAGEFGVLVRGGLTVNRALLFNFLSASTSIVGALLVLFLGSGFEGLTRALIPLTAGNFVYIAAADLIPELHHHHDTRESAGHAAVLVVGVLLTLALTFVRHS